MPRATILRKISRSRSESSASVATPAAQETAPVKTRKRPARRSRVSK